MIGVFDSGFGGLTVLATLLRKMPQYDFLFLGDSARAPYGTRSTESINQFTAEGVEWLLNEGCTVVILACNTASARALRNLQQLYLPGRYPDRRILGLVRPSVEALAGLPPGSPPGDGIPSSIRGKVAVLATESTVASQTYALELGRFAPGIELVQHACPMWVPLVEAGELDGPGPEWFVRDSISKVLSHPSPPQKILLACTHYPLLVPLLRKIVPPHIELLDQPSIVAASLSAWFQRHPEIERRISRHGSRRYATTDSPEWFAQRGRRLLDQSLSVEKVDLHPSSALSVFPTAVAAAPGAPARAATFPTIHAPVSKQDHSRLGDGCEVNPEIQPLGHHRGVVIWLTGLSGAGKTTIAQRVYRKLQRDGFSAIVLDGDILRQGICRHLGFTDADRKQNVMRAGEIAILQAQVGVISIVALISPFRDHRKTIAELSSSQGIPFVEVFVNASIAECERRDPKKLYRRARAGEIAMFTGLDSTYEPPVSPTLELRTDLESIAESVEKVFAVAVAQSQKARPVATS